MSSSRALLTVLAVIVSIALAACGNDTPAGPSGPIPIAFNIVIPPSIVANGDYYAMSGTVSEPGYARIGDTTIEVRTRTFYAQFFTSNRVLLPSKVTLNSLALQHHKDTDTLRLAASSGESSKINATNTWGVTDTAGVTETFPIPAVDPLDSIAPLERSTIVRADTGLSLRWRVPDISQGIYMVWSADRTSYTYSVYIGDSGQFIVPKEELKKLTGVGKVIFTRFYRSTKTYKGNTFSMLRVAQRVYKVTVQP